jgi:hypothetical protein
MQPYGAERVFSRGFCLERMTFAEKTYVLKQRPL